MKLHILGCICLLTLGLIHISEGVTMMSIDLGSEWIKIAVVAPGIPMEIVLNKESKRKTPAAISFRDGERTFGDEALTAGIRIPANNYMYLLDLLGKKLDNPIVQLYKERFPYYNLEEDPERGTVVFVHSDGTKYSVEELLAQLLSFARDTAKAHTGQRIKDAVITVPPFFNQAERRSIHTAAELAGLKVLSLINSNSAVALNYGMFRRKEINGTAQNILFYDMGASSTIATIVSYQTIKTKDRGYSETNPQLTVEGVGYDRTLGGLEFQTRLRNYLAKSFDDMKKTPNSVFDSPRALAKVMKEAGRLKKVLSANADHVSQIEGVLDDKDFRLKVTREEFEGLCVDLIDRVRGPVDAALVSAGVDISTISQFIIVGGATRIPKVQSILQQIWSAELGKNINADEAAAMGAVYRAADLGQGFKVKKFHVKDSVIFPIEVDFERSVENEDGTMNVKTVKRSLFAKGNNYPQKKVMTFNKYTSDFGFSVNYGDVSFLTKNEVKAANVQNVSHVLVKGVTETFAKQLKENAEPKGIKAHFNVDDSGILTLNSVEAVFEKNVTVEVEKEESTLSKIGSTLSKLFSGSDDEAGEGNSTEEATEAKEEAKEGETDGKKDENDTKKGKETDAKGEKGEKDGKKGEKEVKSKLVTVKEELNFTLSYLDLPDLSPEQFKEYADKLEKINKVERKRHEKEAARNNLESYIHDAQDKLWQEDYESCSTEEQRTAIRTMGTELDDWLYEEGFDQEPSVYKEKLSDLKKLFEPIKARVQEHRERPEALKALTDMINMSSTFINTAKNAPEKESYFTDVEIKTLDTLIIDVQKWLEEKEELQEKQPLHEEPKLTVAMIAEKINSLDREIQYLVNKAKIAKAKKDREAAEALLKAQKEKEKNATAEASKNATEEQTINKEDSRQEPPLPTEEDEEEVEETKEENESEANKRKTDEEESIDIENLDDDEEGDYVHKEL